MRDADIPVKFTRPFADAAAGGFVTYPVPASPGAPNRASLSLGFPPECFAAGGAPAGQDFNGVLKQLSAWVWWLTAGAPVAYDAGYQTAIGGYPAGARVLKPDFTAEYVSTADNNLTDPTAGGAGWTQTPGIGPVSNSLLSQMAGSTIKGNPTGVAGAPQDIAITALAALINMSLLAGTVNVSGTEWNVKIGPLIIQGGRVAGTTTETSYTPTLSAGNFPNVCLFATGSALNAAGINTQNDWIQVVSKSATGATFYTQQSGGVTNNMDFDWIQVGY